MILNILLVVKLIVFKAIYNEDFFLCWDTESEEIIVYHRSDIEFVEKKKTLIKEIPEFDALIYEWELTITTKFDIKPDMVITMSASKMNIEAEKIDNFVNEIYALFNL